MGQVIVNLTESPVAHGGPSTNVGAAFFAVATDQGPSTPVLCQSLTDYTNAYGPRSTLSAPGYDTAESFFNAGGAEATFVRVTDETATSATLTLMDGSSHPTVTLTALSPGVDGNGIHVAVVGTELEIWANGSDTSGSPDEVWPFSGTNAELLGIDSAFVTTAQAAGGGFTTAIPASLSLNALSSGADASDLSATSYAAALASFGPQMGPGTVAVPGQTNSTVAIALFEHAAANDRFAVVENGTHSTSSAAVSALSGLAIPSQVAKAGIVIEGSPIVAVAGGATKTIPASGPIAALRAQVAATGSNAAPAFATNGGLASNVVGFTSAYAQDATYGTVWTQGDANSMKDAGLCYFGNEYGVLCLDEFVTPDTTDDVFDQGTAWAAAMMIVSQSQAIGNRYKGITIDGQGLAANALHKDLAAMVQALWTANVLFGDTANDAASINTGSPVNTAATAQAGELNADLAVLLSPYADEITISISVLSLTQTVGSSS